MTDALALLVGLVTIGSAIAGASWMLSNKLRGIDDDLANVREKLSELCTRLTQVEQGVNGGPRGGSGGSFRGTPHPDGAP